MVAGRHLVVAENTASGSAKEPLPLVYTLARFREPTDSGHTPLTMRRGSAPAPAVRMRAAGSVDHPHRGAEPTAGTA